MKSCCLNCHFYKIKDIANGFCRELCKTTGNKDAEKPLVTAEDSCAKWRDAGQQYFIRLGWIKNKKKEENNIQMDINS